MGRKVDAITVHTGMSVDSMLKLPGYEYRDIGTMGKEEAMAAMRIEQRESENDRKGGNQEWV